jgi:hypothetical protein
MSEHAKRKAARRLLSRSGYRVGGNIGDKKIGAEIKEAVHEHESNMHKGKKPTRIKLKDGGLAKGGVPKVRADKPMRGSKMAGHSKPHVAVNVINTGGSGIPHPPAMPRPMGPPMGAPPPGPGAGIAGGMPPGGPPMGVKTGGRTRKRKAGSRTSYPITDGAGSGEGRLQKTRSEAKREGGRR